jgi:nucleotide-binding universal stress UspA family protein
VPYERLLIAVDLEDTSRSVVEAALRIVSSEVKALTLMHAYHIPFEGFIATSVSRTQMADLRKEYKETAASRMSRFQASLGNVDNSWNTRIVQGDARVAIITETIKRHADVVAVGTHGRSGLSHSLVGSIAESVIEASSCDVLVARPTRVSFELP